MSNGQGNTPDDYLCYACGNPVLYPIDHKPDCQFYYNPLAAYLKARSN